MIGWLIGWLIDSQLALFDARWPPFRYTFALREQPHPKFERKGNDLLYTKKITLTQALTGVKFAVTLLDGRSVDIDISDKVCFTDRWSWLW